ncbi:MAG TPA: hypothetical protein VNF91_05890 [Candidatus Acidoferrum sp.]|nr:hypothetical protein [Candidatus Acidoferrum sp.]
MITAAPDTVLEDGRAVCIIRAFELQPGDTVVAHGRVDLHVTGLRRYPRHGLVVADYACTAGSGARTLVAHSFISILPRVEGTPEGDH